MLVGGLYTRHSEYLGLVLVKYLVVGQFSKADPLYLGLSLNFT